MTLLKILCSLIAAFFISAIPSMNNFPNKIPKRQAVFGVVAVSEADQLRFELCPPAGTVIYDKDLAHFCKGVK